MKLSFAPIGLDDQKDYGRRLDACPQAASDYSFINLWSWADVYGLEWAWTDALVWIRQRKPVWRYWAPVGDWESVSWAAEFARQDTAPLEFIRVPEYLVRIWHGALEDRVTAISDRDQYDYIHAAADLIALKGNRFHKKRNLVAQFEKNYTYRYEPLTMDLADKALALQDDWCLWRQCSSDAHLAGENRVIWKVLSHWDLLSGAVGGCLLVEDMVAAYTVGEMVSDDTMVIHFEKGCPNHKGSYQAINRIFLAHQSPGPVWVNREQDLGDQGLRQAKMSYHPERFLEKFNVTII
jgi:uncharacterized protein